MLDFSEVAEPLFRRWQTWCSLGAWVMCALSLSHGSTRRRAILGVGCFAIAVGAGFVASTAFADAQGFLTGLGRVIVDARISPSPSIRSSEVGLLVDCGDYSGSYWRPETRLRFELQEWRPLIDRYWDRSLR